MPVRRHPVAVPRSDVRMDELPIDVALAGRLKATYECIRGRQAQLAERFYAKLFAAAPQLRVLFRSDAHAQAQKLTAALDAVVRNFENPAENAAMLAELGRQHAAFGAKPEHYDLVIELLVESMKELLGEDADCERLDEWRMALRLISDQMINAAGASSSPTLHPPSLIT